jgi:2-C-methyl-D-erythritol 4-phosphate cytidylyltransferase
MIGRTLKEVEVTELHTDTACDLLAAACKNAAAHGLKFRDTVMRLQADDRLQELVRRSRDAAAQGDGSDEA